MFCTDGSGDANRSADPDPWLDGSRTPEAPGILGVSQSRISQIENGNIEAMGLETLRAYAAALGGHLDITISIGPHSVKVA